MKTTCPRIEWEGEAPAELGFGRTLALPVQTTLPLAFVREITLPET